MPEFAYTARDEKGEKVSGTVSAATERDVLAALANKALFPLQVAAENSRQFQDQKERLYLSALSLTGQRNRYSTIFSGSSDPSVGSPTTWRAYWGVDVPMPTLPAKWPRPSK